MVLFFRALSEIGGVYAFLDGLFALIFGRTMMAILFGEWLAQSCVPIKLSVK